MRGLAHDLFLITNETSENREILARASEVFYQDELEGF